MDGHISPLRAAYAITSPMPWLKHFEVLILQLAAHVPLPGFVVLGEIIEEIVSPIPSQLVLITAGSVARAQQWPFIGILFLAVLATLAKTTATMGYYYLADKLEDTLLPKVGKYIGISHQDIESIGKRLDKGGSKEFLSLLVIRCLPILPSVPVSVVCGLVKIHPRTFYFATLAGNLIRGWLVLLTGYLGFDVLESFANGLRGWKLGLTLAIFFALVGFFALGYWKRYGAPTVDKKA